jgi:hypothetical protein
MRDQLRQGERPIQALRGRERGKDPDVIFDDCYEIWVSVGATDTLTGQPDCSTQFVGNFAGARQDAIHQPAVGNSRTSSYDTDWEPVSRLTKDNVWEMELVIPRQSLGTTERPFHDGMTMRALIARNYKRPWEQCSFEGTSTFAVIDSHSEFVLSKTAPALHLLGVGDAATGKIGLQLAAFGQTDTTIQWRYASNAVTKEGTALVRKGVLAEVVDLPDLDTPGEEITATGAETKTLFDQDHRKTVVVASQCGDLAVSSEVTVEFDGMLKVAMTITPTQPTAVKGLKIVLPYHEALADYIHACTAEIRSGYWYGFTPRGTGRVWDCRMLGDKTMKVGSFIPYLWLGSTKGGLCWFADSDEGWIPNDDTPAIEVQRTAPGRVGKSGTGADFAVLHRAGV